MVVDDCSKDDSVAWVHKAMAEHAHIRLVINPHNMGKRIGIAHAVKQANSEIIVSVDSDVMVAKDAVRKLVSAFTEPNIAAVGGRVYVLNCNENWLTKMQTIKYYFGYEFLKNVENSFSTVMCLSGCLTAYKRDVLLQLEPILLNRNIAGIAIKYGEDRFLTRQIVKAGYQTKLLSTAHCYTKAPTTLSQYFSQQLRWRRSNLVDFIGSLSHIWHTNIFVGVHYLSLHCLLWAYPIFLWSSLLTGHYFEVAVIHFGTLAIYGAIYQFMSRNTPPDLRVSGVHFLWMGLIMPMTYMVLTIVAFLTLDSGSWETRVVAKV